MSEFSRDCMGKALRPWLLPLSMAVIGIVGWACREPEDPGSEDGSGDDEVDGTDGSEVSRRDVLASIGTQVIAPGTAEFVTRAQALDGAVATWADASTAGSGADEARSAAQTAWRDAMDQWQRLEVMQVGPAAPSLVGIGGEDLRDSIYSWPTADTCSVDRALVAEDYAAADFFVTELVWAYGLDALEYLLFTNSDAHTCPAQVQLDEPWAALGPEEIARRRSAYARVLTGGLATQAQTLADRWSTDGGDFAALLASPGERDSPYTSEAEALDEVFRAMFYVELQTKDGKLGIPSGAVAGCAEVPCVELLELPHSDDGARAIIANLEGLRLMIQGGPDPATADGFDDLLVQMGEGEIAESLIARLDDAVALLQGTTTALQDQLVADPEAFAGNYEAVKAVTDILKGPFVMALMLTVPAEGAGDND